MKLRYLALALLLAAGGLPARSAAQEAGPPPSRGEKHDRHDPHDGHSPVQRLLHDRAELGLTAAQVSRLEAIDRAMEERNRPYVRQLVELRREVMAQPWMPRRREEMTPEQRAYMKEHFERARPLLEKIRANNHAAMEEVGKVLNDAQRARLREMLERRGKRHDGRHGPDREGRRRDAGV